MTSFKFALSAFNNSPWLAPLTSTVIWVICLCFSPASVSVVILLMPWFSAQALESFIHAKWQAQLRQLQDMQTVLGESSSSIGRLPTELIKPHADLWLFAIGAVVAMASVVLTPYDNLKDGSHLGVFGVLVVWKLACMHSRYQRNASILREEITRVETGIQNLIEAKRSTR